MPLKLTKNQIIIISVASAIVLFFILLFVGVIPGIQKSPQKGDFGAGQQTEINFWGTDPETTIRQLINEYTKVNKSVRIAYREFKEENYEKELINALAGGKGPDILMFRNTWLPKHRDKISPVNETVLNISQFRQYFPTVAEQDFTLQETSNEKTVTKIYSFPLYIDTLALIYNKDVFDAKAVVSPPKTWKEFQGIIPKLRELNEFNQLIKPAAAIGGSEKSIDNASDLLSLLMRQFGSEMTDRYKGVSLGPKGLDAFNFYIQFANASNQYYTWNDNLNNSIDLFSQGTTGIIFNYASKINLIKEKNPFINLGVSLMPQFSSSSQPVNQANYWGLSVSKQSKNQTLAWNFLFYLILDQNISEQYLTISKRPPALRTLIQKYLNDPDLGVFAEQALSARSWPQQDNNLVKQFFSDMIESVLKGRVSAEKALKFTENELNNIR